MPSRPYPLCRGGQDDRAATPIDRVSIDGGHVRCSIDGPPPGAVPPPLVSSPLGYQAVTQWHFCCGVSSFGVIANSCGRRGSGAGRLVLLA
jgi:hypothetical protein